MGMDQGAITFAGGNHHGDALNIAARIQAIAPAGGLGVSGRVYRALDEPALRFRAIGRQSLKNIPKPVHVFRVRIEAEAAPAKAEPRPRSRALVAAGVLLVLVVGSWALWNLAGDRSTSPEAAISEERLTDEELSVPGFSGAPAIAVLAFDNLSDDPEQEYFADGVAEDLITRLSSWRSFPVIARNSSFVYKGKAVDVQQVSRDLGVRYVVEGSVRRAGERVRIWSAGCSSGKEPYSIAGSILSLDPNAGKYDLKVLASDIDPDVLQTAQAGTFHPSDCTFPSDAHRSNIFLPDQSTARPELKSMISFRHLNLIADWPMSGLFDIIMCRNVAIYFDKPTQAQLWTRFCKFLRPDGHLFIGHSERIIEPDQFGLTLCGTTTYKFDDDLVSKAKTKGLTLNGA